MLFSGNLRVAPTERTDATATPLGADLASLLVQYAADRRKAAVLVISRMVLACGGQPLKGNDGWPYMGRCNA